MNFRDACVGAFTSQGFDGVKSSRSRGSARSEPEMRERTETTNTLALDLISAAGNLSAARECAKSGNFVAGGACVVAAGGNLMDAATQLEPVLTAIGQAQYDLPEFKTEREYQYEPSKPSTPPNGCERDAQRNSPFQR